MKKIYLNDSVGETNDVISGVRTMVCRVISAHCGHARRGLNVRVGEKCAIGMSYKDVAAWDENLLQKRIWIRGDRGWNNKALVMSRLMPFVAKVERVWGTWVGRMPEQMCLSAGVRKIEVGDGSVCYTHPGTAMVWDTYTEAVASLISEANHGVSVDKDTPVTAYELSVTRREV